jgi:hypothetical protein
MSLEDSEHELTDMTLNVQSLLCLGAEDTNGIMELSFKQRTSRCLQVFLNPRDTIFEVPVFEIRLCREVVPCALQHRVQINT